MGSTTGVKIRRFCVAFCVLCSATVMAQNGDGTSLLERYGDPGIVRSGPTIDPELAQRMLRRGNTYSNIGRHEQAIEEYRRALAADPSLAEAVRNLANIYLFQERYDEAKPLLARFIQLQGNQISAGLIAAVKTLGELERADGNFELSLPWDRRAIELDPDNDSQVHIMANTYNNAGATEAAIAIYRSAISAMPGNAYFDRSLGRLLEQEGDLEAALAAYQSAATKDPDSEFYANLVQSLERRLGHRQQDR